MSGGRDATTTSGGHGRRIVALFRPYRARLAAVLALIVVSAPGWG